MTYSTKYDFLFWFPIEQCIISKCRITPKTYFFPQFYSRLSYWKLQTLFKTFLWYSWMFSLFKVCLSRSFTIIKLQQEACSDTSRQNKLWIYTTDRAMGPFKQRFVPLLLSRPSLGSALNSWEANRIIEKHRDAQIYLLRDIVKGFWLHYRTYMASFPKYLMGECSH